MPTLPTTSTTDDNTPTSETTTEGQGDTSLADAARKRNHVQNSKLLLEEQVCVSKKC